MRKIHLHGAIGKKYGRVFELDVATAGEAVSALCANFPTFMRDIYDGSWHVVRGKTVKDGISLDLDLIVGFKLGAGDLHIMPAVTGSKNSNMMKIIIGVALVTVATGGLGTFGAAALATPIQGALFGAATWGNLIGSIGVSMVLTGAAGLLAPEQKPQKEENSYLMNGPTGSARQGSGIPIVYGEVMTGGLMISSGLDIDRLSLNGSTGTSEAVTTIKTTLGDDFVVGA